jgi:diguanylate cyclase (GGDEF)-like protein
VISETPLRAFLHNASALSGSASYLVDRSQQVVAAGSRLPDGVTTLAHLDGPLAGKLEHRGSGLYDAASGQRYFASAPITGTPWRLVTTSPRSALFAPVQGASRLVPWLIIGLLGLALMIAAPLAAGLVESRRALRASHEKLERRANVDELTGLFNRRHLREHLDAHVHAGRRHGYPVSVAILDLDHFKRVNDTFGHSAGDAVLSTVSSAIQAQLRQEDVLCRWGGEEFLLLLPYLGPEAAEQAVNRVRLATEQIAIPVGSGGDVIHVTLSAGVSTSRPDEHPDALIHRADLALYVAKSSGRNAVKLADIGVRSD